MFPDTKVLTLTKICVRIVVETPHHVAEAPVMRGERTAATA